MSDILKNLKTKEPDYFDFFKEMIPFLIALQEKFGILLDLSKCEETEDWEDLINKDILQREWSDLSLNELKNINETLYKYTKTNLLMNNKDELHQYMSYLGYLLITDMPKFIFNRDINSLSEMHSFLCEALMMIDACLEKPSRLPLLKDLIYKYKYKMIRVYTYDYVYFLQHNDYLKDIILNHNLNDYKYLYLTGKYVSDNELKIVDYFNKISKKQIKAMAKTTVDGFKRGYKNQNLDFSKKKFVILRYPLGFEKVAKEVYNLLKDEVDVVFKISNSSNPNKQFYYFHKNNKELYLTEEYKDKLLKDYDIRFRLDENYLSTFGGSIWIETFGEENFEPKNEFLFELSDETRKRDNSFNVEFNSLYSKYTNANERSFTIISYPCPDIGSQFEEIFNETIKINTLDVNLYDKIHNALIDELDKGKYVWIKGKNSNKTDLKIYLQQLNNPKKETIFENCLADVNIPVGEVFTTPLLSNTNGVLHVSKVFLRGLEYKDLEILFENGMIKSYNCKNFNTEKENTNFIKENILFNHKTLPIGEFAIGTNTLAYTIARKYQIEDKLDILIAEKTGVHLAVGDTCFSHQEELKTYNPNGKEIIAKENDFSKKRTISMQDAYFGCHTDITIPFDELDFVKVITNNNEEISLIQDGKFVLKGTEELNKYL